MAHGFYSYVTAWLARYCDRHPLLTFVRAAFFGQIKPGISMLFH